MFHDARDVPAGSILDYDVCVIGAGAAGITLAVELMRGSHRVCLLESGGLEPTAPTQSLYQGDNVGHHFSLEASRLRYFGGTTNHWVGDCRPLEPIDLQPRAWVPFSGWPLSYADLEADYPRAHQLLDLGPYDYRPERWSYDHAQTLPFDSNRVITRMSQFSPPTRFGVKFRAELERAAHVDVYLNANATAIERAKEIRGQVQVACLTGSRFTVRARAVVLATGGIENPRLLLSSNGELACGLGNERDLVGRFFMDHLALDVGLMVPATHDLSILDLYEVAGRRLGTVTAQPVITKAFLAFTPEVAQRLALLNVSAILSRAWTPPSHQSPAFQAVRATHLGPADLRTHVTTMIAGWDHLVSALYWKMFERWRPLRLYAARFMSEQTPNRESRVMLSDARDRLGLRRVKVDWRLSEPDYHTVRSASQQLAIECGRSGVGRLQPWCAGESDAEIDRRIVPGAHHMGTTRMHDDPSLGVVDRHLRVHGTRNVYVAGSSVFPSGGHSAPTMTIVALAIRLARHLQSGSQTA